MNYTESSDLRKGLESAFDLILVLEEEVNGLVLRQTAILSALAETLPNFAPAFHRIYADALAEQEKGDNESPQPAREAFRDLRKQRRT